MASINGFTAELLRMILKRHLNSMVEGNLQDRYSLQDLGYDKYFDARRLMSRRASRTLDDLASIGALHFLDSFRQDEVEAHG
ncbi:hypothetical protein PMZ80_001693 [Knufia obscura]|uniref:Uncharacterized protein n=1 Tax=Knufia obscura TaxID=1635080 RepID=A0ABR0S4V6_9EURO|nr:hypothetical protein PMZ80_001693 [Knufia obscura]